MLACDFFVKEINFGQRSNFLEKFLVIEFFSEKLFLFTLLKKNLHPLIEIYFENKLQRLQISNITKLFKNLLNFSPEIKITIS